MELWLHNALREHPWRVNSSRSADVSVLAANFSLWCFAGKQRSEQKLWHAMVNQPQLWPPRTSGDSIASPPKFVALQFGLCIPPWKNSFKPPDVLLLRDRMRLSRGGERNISVVTPFVVSSPEWLVASKHDSHASVAVTTQWDSRSRLLFFSGHVSSSSRLGRFPLVVTSHFGHCRFRRST